MIEIRYIIGLGRSIILSAHINNSYFTFQSISYVTLSKKKGVKKRVKKYFKKSRDLGVMLVGSIFASNPEDQFMVDSKELLGKLADIRSNNRLKRLLEDDRN